MMMLDISLFEYIYIYMSPVHVSTNTPPPHPSCECVAGREGRRKSSLSTLAKRSG